MSLKHHVFLSYLQSLVLLTSRRALGNSILDRSQPDASFSSEDRGPRGSGLGDLVDNMIEGRVVLEKSKALEVRMRYQIEKLVKSVEEKDSESKNNMDGTNSPAHLMVRRTKLLSLDPLAFRPNPQNLATNGNEASGPVTAGVADDEGGDGIYHPPRLAPMPFVEKNPHKPRRRDVAVPSALSSLAYVAVDPSGPHLESASGLGSTPSMGSSRVAHLKRVTDFEEENFTRLVMKKSEAKKRARDEAILALGGDLSTGSKGRIGGFGDEFGDVLRSVERGTRKQGGDGYEELRERGKKQNILQRSRGREEAVRSREDAFGNDDPHSARSKKRSRFERATRHEHRKSSKSKR